LSILKLLFHQFNKAVNFVVHIVPSTFYGISLSSVTCFYKGKFRAFWCGRKIETMLFFAEKPAAVLAAGFSV